MAGAARKRWPANGPASSVWATPTCTQPWTGARGWLILGALADETAATTIGVVSWARAFFAAHGITRINRVITDNGSNYRAAASTRTAQSLTSRHQRTQACTPRYNGKVERYQRLLTEECLYARVIDSEQARTDAIGVWVHHYNYCESWGGWSGTGWQGGHRAAAALRS